MSFHNTKPFTTTVFIFCLLLDQFIDAESKPLVDTNSSSTRMIDFNTTTTVAENNNNFSASTPLPDFLYHHHLNFTGNESLIDEPMSEELFSNFSSVDNETTENMLLDDVSLFSSLISSNIDHSTNFSALVEENGDLYNRSEVASDIATTHSSEMLMEENDDLSLGESGYFGGKLATALQGLLDFMEANTTSISKTEPGKEDKLWSKDPDGRQIEALMFA